MWCEFLVILREITLLYLFLFFLSFYFLTKWFFHIDMSFNLFFHDFSPTCCDV